MAVFESAGRRGLGAVFLVVGLMACFTQNAWADLWVSDSFSVFRYEDGSGDFLGVFVTGGSGGLDNSQGMAFGPDGNLYVASFGSREVLRYDGATGDFIDVFVPFGSGGLGAPNDVAFGPDGNLYVADGFFGTGGIVRYDGETGDFIDLFATGGGMQQPNRLAFGPTGDLFVGNATTSDVLRFDGVSGEYRPAAGQVGAVFVSGAPGPFNTALAFGPTGDLFVASGDRPEVMRYDGVSGAPLGAFAPYGSDIDFGPDGNLYVTDYGGDAVLRYDGGSGAFVDTFVAPGSGGLARPLSLAFDAPGRCCEVIGFAPLGNVNANASVDYGLLIDAGDALSVSVRDSVTGDEIGAFTVEPGDNTARGIAGLGDLDGNGAADAAILLRRPNGQGLVVVHDALTGQRLQKLSFAGAAWDAKAITALDSDGDAREEIGVLLVSDDGQAAGVQVVDTVSGRQLVWIGLPVVAGASYRAVATLDDIDGNGAPEIAALRVNGDSLVDVVVRDGRNKADIATVSFVTTGKSAAGIAGVGDIDGSGAPEIALLLVKPDGRARVHLKDAADGLWLGSLNFLNSDWRALAISAQDADGNGGDEISVLGLADGRDRAAIQSIDASTGVQVDWLGIPLD